MINKLKNSVLAALGFALLLPAIASAHVVVTPAEVTVGERQTFSVSVPNEKDTDVTSVKLDIPRGAGSITPTVKPGWTITTDKTGTGEEAVVKSITWTGGAIPAGQRDDFTFRALAPEKASELQWIAYETYTDGSTVSWNQKPTEDESESETVGPYSVTKVVNDLDAASAIDTEENNDTLPLIIAVLALVTAAAALLRPAKKV